MKHAPSHPRFQAAALFHIVRLICLGCSETKTFFSKAVFFPKTVHLVSSSFFQRLFDFISCLFFQRLSIFSAGLFFKDFLPANLFFQMSFSQRLFSQLSVFFKAAFLAKDRQSKTGRTTWWDNLCCSVCPLPKSILEYLAVFLFSRQSFFLKGLLKC